jgi:hypothetical protein
MKLSVNYVGQGCFYRAGEEIDESEVPLAIRKYAVTVSGDDGVTESPIPDAPEPAVPAKRHVKARKACQTIGPLL